MGNYLELMKARHSVRQFEEKPIPADIREQLEAYCRELNEKSGLNMQIIYDDPTCYSTGFAHYGNFEGCSNYIVLVGNKKTPKLDELCGYYGEFLVLKAQELGLNTCWTATTHGKSKAVVAKDEVEIIIIALGYGRTQGHDRKCKEAAAISNIADDSPEWFKKGVEAALLAPTAMNQQKFKLTLSDGKVRAESGLLGPCLKIDLGIVKCHFELGAGKENFEWA
ncbi:MAG: nitroreductase [Clostridia bacterium]|nr:nitroreductase [Clostridia bacterium]MBQ1895391.1 nitroreductase [Clostridia bacterium]MBQ2092601.1 nitroreductase [Clostridia bacterium]MBQ3898026.1 nitroreductase [Clostridia bacterium]